WYIVTKYGQARANIYDGSTGGYDIAHDTRISDNKWHHVVLVRDAAKNMSIYVDGVLGGTGSDAYTIANAQPLQLGDNLSNASGGANHQGQIDETRYYNRALSEEEISQLYEYGLADEGAMVFDERHASMKYCNGTDWVHAGLGPYVPNAVYFDGTNDYLRILANLTGNSDSKLVSGSGWFKKEALGSQIIYTNTSGGFRIRSDASDNFIIEGENIGDTGLVLEIAASSPIADYDWHHFMFSVDMSDTNKRHLYIDGVDSIVVGTYLDSAIRTTGTGHAFGSDTGGGISLNAALADIWLDYGTYVDLSKVDNRRKFISNSGMPMYLGADGSLPTGSPPDIFLSGDT
ncbi:MAG: LamG domain-containing protein, partial [Pseudomonadota bacterium]|nr:LamG domain-containing protein [Pseudomonadota bacterium]